MIHLLATVALAWESTVVPLQFSDENPVFQALTFDTGYLPSQGDPVSVRFSVTPTGGVSTAFDAESTLTWPDGLDHHVAGVPGSGQLSVDASVTVLAEVWLNLLIWSGSVPLWEQELVLTGETSFDPLALGAEPVSVQVADPGLVPPFSFEVAVITGIDLVLDVAAVPALTSTLAATDLWTESDNGGWAQLTDGETVDAALPSGRPDALDLTTTWSAVAGNTLELVLVPSASIDTWIGSFTLLSFDIPVPLVDAEEVRALSSGEYAHPLPVLLALIEAHDFGEVEAGGLANFELALLDDGLLPVEGTVRIEGDPAFSVWPETVYIPPGGLDGVVVTFAPDAPGEVRAEVVIASNDPIVPELRIPLVGVSPPPPEPEAPGDDDPVPVVPVSRAEVSGCGCNAGSAPPWPLLGLAVLGLRRTRRSGRHGLSGQHG